MSAPARLSKGASRATLSLDPAAQLRRTQRDRTSRIDRTRPPVEEHTLVDELFGASLLESGLRASGVAQTHLYSTPKPRPPLYDSPHDPIFPALPDRYFSSSAELVLLLPLQQYHHLLLHHM